MAVREQISRNTQAALRVEQAHRRDAIRMLAVGMAIGVPTAIAGGKYIRSQLFGLRPADPLTLALACLAMAAVALLAGYLPARRASRVDPMTALRYE